jgi:RHS repeat-associated protein
VKDALGNVSTVVYGAAGNVSAQVNALGNRVTFVYDADNRRIAVTDELSHTVTTTLDAVGNATSIVDAGGNLTTFTFDALNRQVTAQNPAGGVATTVYDAAGNVVNQVDQLGHKATFVYDALNRRTQSIDALAGKTTLAYDGAGNTVNVIDPDGNKTTFVYDALNRQTQMTDPLGNSGTYAYDAASRLTSATDRDGRRIDYSYDAANRKTGEVWKNAALTTVNTLTFTYDAANNLLTATANSGAYTLVYDAATRVTNVSEPFGATLTLTYDAASNRTKLQDSLGGLTTFVYDAANNLAAEMFSGISVTVLEEDLTYTATNQPSTAKRYEGPSPQQFVGSTTFVYDTTSRLTNLLHRNGSATLLANYTYVYDTASRLTSETDNGTPTTYTYDNTNQLTGDGTNSWSYDANGNRTNSGYVTGTGNQLTNDGVFTYTYDAEGNLTKKSKGLSLETWKFQYDNRNHMTVAEKWSADTNGTLQMRATYTYDVFGNRDKTEVDPDGAGATGVTTTKFVLDGWKTHQDALGLPAQFVGNENWDEIADLDGSNGLVTRRISLSTVDSAFAKIASDGTANWFLGDHLGSIRDITSLISVVIDHRDWGAWGNIVTETSSANTDRYGWTSRELDSETGLQYNRAREVAPGTGLWTSRDRLGFFAGDSNLYRYGANNPIGAVDPK